MRILSSGLTALVLLALAAISAPALADDLADAGRAIVRQNRNAIVTLRLVIDQKMDMSGMGNQQSETVMETTGTIIGEDGLTVASLTATDPMRIVNDMLSGLMPGDMQMSFRSEITDVTLLLESGDEVTGHVVLRDEDLDLIFVRPDALPDTLRPVAASAAASVEQFDRLVLLRRLGKVADRALSGTFPRVQAVMEKPRTLYVIGDAASPMAGGGSGGLGEPAFDLNGTYVGMTTLRKLKAAAAGMSPMGLFSMASDFASNMTIVIVPAEDILEAAEQAPPAKAEE